MNHSFWDTPIYGNPQIDENHGKYSPNILVRARFGAASLGFGFESAPWRGIVHRSVEMNLVFADDAQPALAGRSCGMPKFGISFGNVWVIIFPIEMAIVGVAYLDNTDWFAS